jgi:hypothetical protein
MSQAIEAAFDAEPVQAAQRNPAIRLVHGAACLAGLTLIVLAVVLDSYNYQTAWVSAHFAVIAKAFNTFGLVDLGFVPVQNNPPLTTSPDAYLHWPPLYPIVLAWVFRAFGDGVIVHHLSSVLLVFGSAALVWRSFAAWPDKAAAGIAVLTFLAAPMIIGYGFSGIHLHLALLLTLLALVLFAANTGPLTGSAERSRALMLGAGGLAYFAAVLTSWEPLLAAPAFGVFAWMDRRRQTVLALVFFGCAAILALLAIVWLYGSQYPHFLDRLWHRGLLRAGLSVALPPPDYTPHDWQDLAGNNPTHPWLPYLRKVLGRLRLLGLLGLAGLAGGLLCLRFWSSLPRPTLAIYLGSFSMFVLWATLMRNHMGIHEYEMLIAVPAAASGAGLVWCQYFRPDASAREQGPHRLVLAGSGRQRAIACLLAPVLAILSCLSFVHEVATSRPYSDMIALADLANEVLPQNAILVTPHTDMVFVYYSQRHVVRTIESEEVLDHERRGLAALCSDCPLYLAASNLDRTDFPSYQKRGPLAELPGIGAIWRVGP